MNMIYFSVCPYGNCLFDPSYHPNPIIMENQKDLVKSILLQIAPQLTDAQFNQLLALIPLYQSWNEKINLISRKDMDHFVVHHLLHFILIQNFLKFAAGIKVLDLQGQEEDFLQSHWRYAFPR